MIVSSEDILSFNHKGEPAHFIIIDLQPKASAVVIQKSTTIICKS